MPSESLLDLKRGIDMEKKVKVIKDTPRAEEQVRNGDVISLMEKEWPEMTKEFKNYKGNNTNCFYINNMITVLATYRLVHN